MSILTPQELARLRLVKATREEATQILNRNTPLDKVLDSLPPTLEEAIEKHGAVAVRFFMGSTGCPHCNNCQCGDCAWGKEEMACCSPTFGGISLSAMEITRRRVQVSYHADAEHISIRLGKYPPELRIIGWEQSLKEAKNFVGGHIEWALDMLERLNK